MMQDTRHAFKGAAIRLHSVSQWVPAVRYLLRPYGMALDAKLLTCSLHAENRFYDPQADAHRCDSVLIKGEQ